MIDEMTMKIPRKKPLIFIVDDEPMLLETFSSLLSESYNTRGFESPKAFLSYIDDPNSIHPDLLISDFMMPGITGTEMISQAIERGMDFPSILLSGNLDKESVIQAVNIGVFKVFEKPIRTDVLMGAIDQLLIEHEISRAREEIRCITKQLREVYSNFRLITEAHLPSEIIENLKNMIDSGGSGAQAAPIGSFDDLMDQLESRLEILLNTEAALQELRHNKVRASA
ncbi:MAG: response regulator [Bdellovibrionaceae bacterium]|nr:response regulator [Bdellovibrionales bacterium]MCB9085084.1 response regulator [Pseudobdellovibrionaceae bacterium]